MSYTSNIEKDHICNYIDPNTSNASKILLSCINKPEVVDKSGCNYSTLNIPTHMINKPKNQILEDQIEGFSSDMTSGPGVSYNKSGCPDGQTKINGECYQVCRGCNYNDKKGYFGDSSKFPFGENSRYNGSCGSGYILQGVDQNGFIRCKKGEKKINTTDDDFNISPFV